MPAVLSKDVIDKIRVIVLADDPILTRLTELEGLLIKEHLMSKLNVPISKLQVHKVNRSGLGVNPHEVHRLGKRVSVVGFKLTELDIWCIEEPNCPKQRQEQQAFNEALINGSKKFLAPLNGDESWN